MNDEIKEILECLKIALDSESYEVLLDYITNLQQENDELKKESEKLTQLWLDSQEKRRKVIEYIDKQKKKMYKSRNKIALFVLMKLENILQNGGEENE